MKRLSLAAATLLPLVCLLFVTGCITEHHRSDIVPFSTPLGQYKSVSVQADSTAARFPENLDELVRQLERSLVDQLKTNKVFAEVQPASAAAAAGAELRIHVTVLGLN